MSAPMCSNCCMGDGMQLIEPLALCFFPPPRSPTLSLCLLKQKYRQGRRRSRGVRSANTHHIFLPSPSLVLTTQIGVLYTQLPLGDVCTVEVKEATVTVCVHTLSSLVRILVSKSHNKDSDVLNIRRSRYEKMPKSSCHTKLAISTKCHDYFLFRSLLCITPYCVSFCIAFGQQQYW